MITNYELRITNDECGETQGLRLNDIKQNVETGLRPVSHHLERSETGVANAECKKKLYRSDFPLPCVVEGLRPYVSFLSVHRTPNQNGSGFLGFIQLL